MYTTGELAKLCNVSVRTVQYYDERGILTPSELTEGGRRLFSEEDVKTMETICFLRNIGISINNIAEIFKSEESKDIISLLLKQHESTLEKELNEKNEQLKKIKDLQNMLYSFSDASEKSIHNIAEIINSKEALKKMYTKAIIVAAPIQLYQLITLFVGVTKGLWLYFFVAVFVELIYGLCFMQYWYKRIKYICPECHTDFKPELKEAIFGNHTLKTRRVTCPCCNKKIWCIELYDFGKTKEVE